MPANKKQIRECRDIHEKIDELIPRVYAEEVQARLKAKGIDETTERIQNARLLRIYVLEIMQELQAYCEELYPEDFQEVDTGLQ